MTFKTAYRELSEEQREALLRVESCEIRRLKLQAQYFADWLADRMVQPGPLLNSEYETYAAESGEPYVMSRSAWSRILTALFGGSVQVRGPSGKVVRARMFTVTLPMAEEVGSESK